MEGEAVSNRPESPKKRIKSNPTSDSEAQPSNYSKSSDKNDGHLVPHVNGLHVVAPARKERFYSSAADSSSEMRISPESPRVQEEEVSSSENCVRRTETPAEEGGATQETAEDFTLLCDSASSSDSTNEKH